MFAQQHTARFCATAESLCSIEYTS